MPVFPLGPRPFVPARPPYIYKGRRDGPCLIQYIVPTAGYVFCGGAGGRRNSRPRRGVFAIQIHFWPAPPLYFGKMLNFAADRAKKCTFVHRNHKAN